jgi:hypothetical protein
MVVAKKVPCGRICRRLFVSLLVLQARKIVIIVLSELQSKMEHHAVDNPFAALKDKNPNCILGLFPIRMEDLRGRILRFQMTEFRQLFRQCSA